ncbi:MAG: adenylosuccinate lyase, partial [Verrucomicrobiota bacterium]
ERLANDERIGMSRADLDKILERGRSRTGSAKAQVEEFVANVEKLCQDYPDAKTYEPGAIL